MKAKTIKLCEGHKGGFGLLKIIPLKAVYRGTPVAKLKVVLVDRGDSCVQCRANRIARERKARITK